MQFDELLLVETLLGVTAATAVLCMLLLQSARHTRSSTKKSKSVERRPAERYTDELAA